MRRTLVFVSAVVSALGLCVSAYGDEFKYEVGQVWTYELEKTPGPGGEPTRSTYTLAVLRQEKVGETDCWVIEEHHSSWGRTKREHYVGSGNAEVRMIVRDGRSGQLIECEPVLEDPFFSLEAGQEKETGHIMITRSLEGGAELDRVRFTRAIKRLPDESVTVPAGTFPSCRKTWERTALQMESEERKLEIVTEREAYWDEETGLVKETYLHPPLTLPNGNVVPERRSTSVLRSFVTKKQE